VAPPPARARRDRAEISDAQDRGRWSPAQGPAVVTSRGGVPKGYRRISTLGASETDRRGDGVHGATGIILSTACQQTRLEPLHRKKCLSSRRPRYP
jgi:hypothetical protein